MKYLRQEHGFYKGAIALMVPIIIQNIVTNFMSLADTFMVGALGETELAAVTMANSLFFVVQLLIFGVQSGASVLVAQYNGRGNTEAINRVMGMGLYVSAGLTAVVAVAAFSFPKAIMAALTNNADLIVPGADYMRIVGFSYFFMAINGVYIAVQRSMENPRLGAVLLSVSGVLDMVLNYMMIFGKWGMPAMGCAGAALSTVISRIFESVVLCVYAGLSRRLPLLPARILHPGKIIAADFLRYSLPVVMNESLWGLAMSLYSVIMGHMPGSTRILAAYTIEGNIERMISVALFASGSAAAVIIGRDIGRGDRDTLYGRGIALNMLCLATGVVSSVLLLLVRDFAAAQYIYPIMDISPAAGKIADYMMLIAAFVLPLRATNLCNVVGVFRGGGDVRYALFCDLAPMYALCLPAAAVAALLLGAGIEIVFPIFCMDELIKVFLCLPRLRSGKWMNSVTRDVFA